MNVVDGTGVRRPLRLSVDVAIVGSGPAGASVARELARAGAKVAVVEEGPWVRPEAFREDAFSAMAQLYRDLGASVMLGNAPMPYLQARALGGTSVVNGAISWRLPRDIWDEWVTADRPLADALPWHTLDATTAEIERDLGIAPTDGAVAGPHNLLLARGAEALGLAHRPIARNVRGCRGLGRCLQGCPEGNKLSMDRSFLAEAADAGARLYAGVRVEGIVHARGRATGLWGRAAGGGRIEVAAGTAVVVAASAVQTPLLLRRSGLHQGPVGDGFQCHPGVSVSGRFREPVRMWTGATQGHEVIGLRPEGIKFEALGFDMAVVAMRQKGMGRRLAAEIADLPHALSWGAALRADARGTVRRGFAGPRIRFSLTRRDVARLKRGVRVLGEMLLAAGAQWVAPGVHGWHEQVADRAVMATFEADGPDDPRAYTLAATHLFGSCRMGSDPRRSVVRPDLRHHHLDRLYVADSSVFPSNTGVNPQTSILAIASLLGRRLGARG
jgi:choline dehydrogenase-like flavoprotein